MSDATKEINPYKVRACDKGSPGYRLKRYRARAEALRRIAAEVDGESQKVLLQLAQSYEKMAVEAEAPTGPLN
jgi:hypothetical protein